MVHSGFCTLPVFTHLPFLTDAHFYKMTDRASGGPGSGPVFMSDPGRTGIFESPSKGKCPVVRPHQETEIKTQLSVPRHGRDCVTALCTM